jgi:mannose-6-phosphate isomerase-like protein (cupin superfamily)
MIYSKENAIRHYLWGDNCDGWEYLETPTLSIRQERMPPGTAEKMHYHKSSQQFFYILSGEACFELEGEIICVQKNQGIHVSRGQKHRILNEGKEDLEFLLTSEPPIHGDRYEVS